MTLQATPRILLLLALSLWLGACSFSPDRPDGGGIGGDSTGAVRQQLYAQYGEWRGVRYRNGGLSKAGIDCSGLVYLTYRDRFGVQLPRNTRDLSSVGVTIDAQQRRAGDLLFFRINRWTNHVGIYLEDGRFLHASTSSGVMISHVDEPYWKSRYWKSTRPPGANIASRD